MAATALQGFLWSTPTVDGAYEISAARAYAHDEADYDRQYNLEQFSLEDLTREAGHLVNVCKKHGLANGGSILEIGCGTGRISIGLAMQPEIGHLLITDPSPAFCRIVQRKLAGVAAAAGRVDLGILRAEDIALLPAESVSVILLRSVLHHIADVDEFLRGCARVLSIGGLVVCEEPYYEGYLIMGLLGQFLEDALTASGYFPTPQDRERIKEFVATMQFYGRRDLDKTDSEDKHLFRPDELMVTGRSIGLELTHYPNWSMTQSPEQNVHARTGYFQRFFVDYLHYCMGWPQDLAKRVGDATRKHFAFFEPLEKGGNTAPACFGTFVFLKR
jgi:ubiquinone/menaquinone biosynthesis C-methylase UbiE